MSGSLLKHMQRMAQMLCEEDNVPSLLLCDADFPCEYVNMQHPEDYKLQDAPITPSFIVNQRRGHARLKSLNYNCSTAGIFKLQL